MSTGAKIGITVLVIVLGIIGFVVGNYFSHANRAVDYETKIETAVQANKGALGQFRLAISEQVQTLGLGGDIQADSVSKQIEARYGEGGSKAAFQWIQEQNFPGVTPESLETVMRNINAGRADFQSAQERLLDVCRGYKSFQRKPYSGFWLRIAGYPSSEYNEEGGNGKLCRAITSKGAQEAFDTGVEQQLDIRGGNPDA